MGSRRHAGSGDEDDRKGDEEQVLQVEDQQHTDAKVRTGVPRPQSSAETSLRGVEALARCENPLHGLLLTSGEAGAVSTSILA